VDQTYDNGILTGLAARLLSARAGAFPGNILQTLGSTAQLTSRAQVLRHLGTNSSSHVI
jgi:hypothetical protein